MRDCNKCPGPGFDPTEQTGPVYLGGVLGIDVNGVRQPIDAEGIVELQVDAQAAADSAAAAADSAAEALQWAVRSTENARIAKGYADNSATIMGRVMQSEADAEVSASDAEESATQAAGSATAAAASAAAAQTAAERDVPAAAAAWLAEHVDPATGYVLDDSLTIQGAAADAKATGDAVSGVRSMILDDAEALSYALTAGKYVRIANGAVVNSTSYNATEEIPLAGYAWIVYAKMRMRVESTQAAAIAFYDAQHAYLIGYAPTTSAATVGADMTAVEIPDGAAYARITYYNGNYDVPPLTIFGLRGEQSVPARIDKLERASYAALGLHTIPQSQGVLNAIKRARQMTDIEWTPAVDLPRACSLGGAYSRVGAIAFENVFKAGVTYRGIPYSRSDINAEAWGYDTMTVGLDVPFSAFVTAAASPDSVIAEESEYQTGGGSPRSVYFGTICSGLVCYALGIDHLYLTADMPSIPGMARVGALISNGVRFNINTIRLGDLLLKTGFHVSMVTDIIMDGGAVTAVEVSEATTGGDVANTQKTGGPVGGLCRRAVWPVEEFFSWWRDYTVYRYANIDAVPYTSDPYVRVGTEGWTIHYDKMPVIPYMGEGFVYKAGSVYSDALVIMAAADFETLRIYKDGALFAELAVGGQTSIAGGFSAAGQYEAYLCNLSGGNEVNRSVSCHWSVI